MGGFAAQTRPDSNLAYGRKVMHVWHLRHCRP
jgi:hypothetical protein